MEIVRFPGYIEEEKVGIARQSLIPRQMEEHGLLPAELQFADSTVQGIIRQYAYEAGVRNLEREMGRTCRKVTRSSSTVCTRKMTRWGWQQALPGRTPVVT
jgi:ATP-dependent Lon protease